MCRRGAAPRGEARHRDRAGQLRQVQRRGVAEELPVEAAARERGPGQGVVRLPDERVTVQGL